MNKLGAWELLLVSEPVGGVGANQSFTGDDRKKLIATELLDPKQIAERQMSLEFAEITTASALIGDGSDSVDFKWACVNRSKGEVFLDLRDSF